MDSWEIDQEGRLAQSKRARRILAASFRARQAPSTSSSAIARLGKAKGFCELSIAAKGLGAWLGHMGVAAALGEALARSMGRPVQNKNDWMPYEDPGWIADAHEKSLAEGALLCAVEGIDDPKAQRAFVEAWVGVDKDLGSTGIIGAWLAAALARDDQGATQELLDAGADPFALCVGGWHPLDWAWRCRAVLSAGAIAARVVPEERAAQGQGGRAWSRGEPFASSKPQMSSIFLSEAELSGFESSSRVDVAAKVWMRQDSGRAFGSKACFEKRLSCIGRWRAPCPWTSMEEAEALAWWSQATADGAQRAWIEAVQIEAQLRAWTGPGLKPGAKRL